MGAVAEVVGAELEDTWDVVVVGLRPNKLGAGCGVAVVDGADVPEAAAPEVTAPPKLGNSPPEVAVVEAGAEPNRPLVDAGTEELEVGFPPKNVDVGASEVAGAELTGCWELNRFEEEGAAVVGCVPDVLAGVLCWKLGFGASDDNVVEVPLAAELVDVFEFKLLKRLRPPAGFVENALAPVPPVPGNSRLGAAEVWPDSGGFAAPNIPSEIGLTLDPNGLFALGFDP